MTTQLELTARRTFHHSSLESGRMQKLLRYLESVGDIGATTMQICQACQTTRASSDISELRANGVEIEDQFDGTNENGRKIYRYRLKTI